MNNKLVWVGVRESDIDNTGSLFFRSVTIHGSGENGNISMDHSLGKRFNHNSDMDEYDRFFQESIHSIIESDPDAKFIFYDNIDAASFKPEIQSRIIFRNSEQLLEAIDDKLYLKHWAQNLVNILPFKTVFAKDITEELINHTFPYAKRIVVQKSESYGGNGTFLVPVDSLSKIRDLEIDPHEQVIIAEYQENCIPINIHCVLYSQTHLLFSPSIQLINSEHHQLEYIGSDYSAFQMLSDYQKELIFDSANRICRSLRESGYLGVCGIDFILTDDKCWFMEINGRFQASSSLLNQFLSDHASPSLHEYHIDAFLHNTCSLPQPPVTAEGSMLVYNFDKSEKVLVCLKWLYHALRRQNDLFLVDDSLDWQLPIEKRSYLFQLRSKKNIASITFQNTVRIHPNAIISHYQINSNSTHENLLKLKMLLLTRGVSISSEAWNATQNGYGIDWEEFDAITIRLFHKIWVTSPSFEAWYNISPLCIDYNVDRNEYYLSYYHQTLFPIEIMGADPLSKKLTKNGHYFNDIVYLNPDRLRVYHRNGCALQDKGAGCKFCDLFGCKNEFNLCDIMEATSYYFKNKKVRHFLIGGGSELSENDCSHIVTLAQYIYNQTGKPIYLMSQPIHNEKLLLQLKESGITEIAFNVEIFNREIAKYIMPGKSGHSLEYYEECLRKAVEIWGNTGKVRSAVVLGFDGIEDFKVGIRRLCKIGVAPMLSVFRPCPDTPLENDCPPTEEDVYQYYCEAERICAQYGIELGPSCTACQNNTVALDY